MLWRFGGIREFFSWLGLIVAQQPRKTLLLGTVVTLACAVGWLQLFVEERPEQLYTPQASRAFDDKAFVESVFGHGFRRVDIFVTPRDKILTPLVSKSALRDTLQLYRRVLSASAAFNGTTLGLRDVCVLNRRGNCATESVLAFFNYSGAVLEAATNIPAAVSLTMAPDCCGLSPVITPSTVMGSVGRGIDGNITSVGAFRISFTFHNNLVSDTPGAEPKDPRAIAVENALTDIVDRFDRGSGGAQPVIRAAAFTVAAFDAAMAGAIQSDIQLVSVAVVILILYATFVMYSEFGAGALGGFCTTVVMVAVVASFGIVIGAGQPFSLAVNSAIFVLLGLGVDDAFVIMAAHVRQPKAHPAPERASRALAEAGGSITLTSLTDLTAFLIGSTTTIPALRSFCIFAAVAVFFDFVAQVTLFMAGVVLLGDRQWFCSRHAKTGTTVVPDRIALAGATGMSAAVDQKQQNQKIVVPALTWPHPNPVDAEGRVAAQLPENAQAGRASRMQRLLGEMLPSAILSRRGKIVVLTCTLALLALMCFGTLRLQMAFHYDWFVPDDVPVKATMRTRDEHFGGMFLPVDLVTRQADYHAHREDFRSMTDKFQADASILPGSVDSWYDAFLARERAVGELPVPATSASFVEAVRTFVSSEAGQRHAANVKFDWKNSTILATRVPALFVGLPSIKQELAATDSTRAVTDSYPVFSGTAYSYPMLFWEGLAVVETEILRNVSLAAVCVFVMCWAVLNSLRAAVIVLFNIAMIDVCLLGSMYFVGDPINMVTAINLLLAIGLCIDCSAHVAHAFLTAHGTRDERAATALKHIGLSVFNGSMTTFVSCFPMFAARSYIFQVFARMFMFIVLWGLYFGVIVLPVLLSIYGPLPVITTTTTFTTAAAKLQRQDAAK